jgi:hypothetical protein
MRKYTKPLRCYRHGGMAWLLVHVVRLDKFKDGEPYPVLRIAGRIFSYAGRNDNEESGGDKELPHSFIHAPRKSALLRNYLGGEPSSFSFSDEEFARFVEVGKGGRP